MEIALSFQETLAFGRGFGQFDRRMFEKIDTRDLHTSPALLLCLGSPLRRKILGVNFDGLGTKTPI